MALPLASTRPIKLESLPSIVVDRPLMLTLSDPDSSSPSLYATFKILQLVRSFAKRVNTRGPVAPSPTKTRPVRARQDLCQEFERIAYDQIDTYLGRKQHRRARTLTKTAVADEREPLPSKDIQWILSQVERSGTESYSLDTVAKSDKLFFQRRADFHVKPLCLGELTHRVIVIRDLLDSLRRTPRRDRVRTLCEGNEVLDADDTYLANLQHLLLCLYHQLLQLLVQLVVKLAHRHLIEWQKDQDKHGADWFFVFPDVRHPLSTTWPWSIRPSLAVLWGVCWMFYDFAGCTLDAQDNLVDAQGNIIASSELQDQIQQFLRRSRAERESITTARTAMNPVHRDVRLPRSGFSGGMPHYYSTTPPHTSEVLGQITSRAAAPLFATYGNESPLFRRPSGPHHPSPSIHVTRLDAQPQDTPYLSPHPRQPPFMTSELPVDIHTPVSPGSPRRSPLHHSDDHVISQLVNEISAVNRKRSFSQMTPNGALQLQQTEQPYSRRPSVMSAAEEDSPPPQEQGEPRGSRSFKRGDPPMNADSKFYCNYSNDCSALIFDRKCEWSKHMDKHDRPYRCQHATCAKLQGFTYSGGLLRHEREVHGKHGGPKAQLMCPIEDCKRHSGKGFTRKENLNEHIRRVHDTKSQGLPSQSLAVSRRETMDTTQGAADEAVETPSSDMVGPDELIESLPFGNRKRSVVEDLNESPIGDVDTLHHQIKRLRAENKAKDERLRMLEQSQMEHQQEVERLNATLMQIQQSRATQPTTWNAIEEQPSA